MLVERIHFTGEKIIKECLQTVTNVACPDKNTPFPTIRLSGFTIERKIEKHSDDIQMNLKMKATNVLWFSVAVDRSTAVGDTMQHVSIVEQT
jgi:hypothetical protein